MARKKLTNNDSELVDKPLTKKQKRFVQAYVVSDTKAEAGRIAYPDNKYPTQMANQTLKNPQVQKEIDFLQSQIEDDAPEIYKAMKELALTAKSESVRIQAMKHIMGLAGYTIITQSKHTTQKVDINTLIDDLRTSPKQVDSTAE